MTETKTDKTKRRSLRSWSLVRHVVQIAFVLLFCAPLIVAGWNLFGIYEANDVAATTPADGVFYGSLASSAAGPINLLDPFGALQIFAASKSFAVGSAVAALTVCIVYFVIGGRAFCGWVCPVNLLLEATDWIRRKTGMNVAQRTIPRHAKVWIAVAILAISAIVSIPVFEAFSPIGAINRGILFGSTAGIVTLGAIVIVELFWSRRVWCRSLCPLGGFYEVLGKCGLTAVRINHEACTHCGVCEKACLCDPEILKPAVEGLHDGVWAGDCMVCGACVDACPHRALRLSVGKPRVLELQGNRNRNNSKIVDQIQRE